MFTLRLLSEHKNMGIIERFMSCVRLTDTFLPTPLFGTQFAHETGDHDMHAGIKGRR